MTTDITVGPKWDILGQNETNGRENNVNNGQQDPDYEFDYDGGNSSSRLFERSRIKALAGKFIQWGKGEPAPDF